MINSVLVKIFLQPIMEAVYDSHQRRLVQIAADSRGGPRLVAVGVEADSDANVGRRVLRGYINGRDAESA